MARPTTAAEREYMDADASSRPERAPERPPGLCRVIPIGRHDEAARFRIVAPPGWRFGGEQQDPHVVTYRSDATGWPGPSAIDDATAAASDLHTWLIRCDCATCEDA